MGFIYTVPSQLHLIRLNDFQNDNLLGLQLTSFDGGLDSRLKHACHVRV